jgi:hypothetical protein
MKSVSRTILTLTLMLGVALAVSAQERPSTEIATETTAAAAPADASIDAPGEATATEATDPARSPSSYEIRNLFTQTLRDHPADLARTLVLNPTLLSNQAFLAGYPRLAQFVQQYPEVAGNPSYYLADFQERRRSSFLEDIIEPIIIFATIAFIALALGWLIRTIIEQKRWNRLSKSQNDVHNKILDRFNTSEELLEYVKSAAGSKFLESAPIAVRSETPSVSSPLSRIIWSVQLGVVVAAGAVGLLLVSLRLDAEASRELFALGMIAFFVGLGFIASAAVSIYMSRRLGLDTGIPPERADDPGAMR